MPLPRPVSNCPICGDRIKGRTDKIFCGLPCKSEYHRRRRLQREPISYPIDQILHRNWVILQELHDEIGKRKFFVSHAKLNKAGFHGKYYTTSETNNQGKTYFYVYNFGWMRFSEKEMMIIKLKQVK